MRSLYGLSTQPIPAATGPTLAFIKAAQMTMVYGNPEQDRWERQLVTQRLATLVQSGAVVVFDPADTMEGN